jgi:hypothetical protein
MRIGCLLLDDTMLFMDSDGQHLKPQGYHWSLVFISTISLYSVFGIAYSALILKEFLISDFDFACACLFWIYMWLTWSLSDMKWVFIFVSKFSHRERCLQVRELMHADIKSEGACKKEWEKGNRNVVICLLDALEYVVHLGFGKCCYVCISSIWKMLYILQRTSNKSSQMSTWNRARHMMISAPLLWQWRLMPNKAIGNCWFVREVRFLFSWVV